MIHILPQPDDSTCGPTCLHAVYAHYGDRVDLADVIADISPLPTGGTLAVVLGCHALARGYAATIYTHNLQVFDPTWFRGKSVDLRAKLAAQAAVKSDAKLQYATRAYLEFLARGGSVRYEELSVASVAALLDRDAPLLTGLSATYL